MGKRLSYLFLILICILFVGLSGCEGPGDEAESGNDEATSGLIVVEPSGSVSLGYFDEQVFRVKLTGADGKPMEEEPVIVSFIGPAYNSHLEPSLFDTDGTGVGEVVFTAPDKVASFPIRFMSPAIDEAVVVDVVVDPALIGLSFNVTYSGTRQIDGFEASLFEEIACEDLADDDKIEPVETIEAAALPAPFEFSGLRHGRSYSARVLGLNPAGDIRVISCLDGLLPSDDAVDVELVDMPFSAGGNFNLTIDITPDGTMDRAVDELAALVASSFSDDPVEHILQGVRNAVIIQDPLAGVAYDELRNRFILDELLEAHFSTNSIDVAGSMDSIWLATKDYFSSVTVRSRLGLGSPEEETYTIAHQVENIHFLNGEGESVSIPIFTSEFGKGTANLVEDEADLLYINRHYIVFGLGGPIYLLLMQVIDDQLEAKSFNQALYKIVDCDRVADVLEPKLDTIASWSTIRSGCESATVTADGWFTYGIALLDAWYRRLVFEGSCRLGDPPTGLQVVSLVDGEFDVTWRLMSTIGPMDATFEGELSEDR